jgi:hypothetical protein
MLTLTFQGKSAIKLQRVMKSSGTNRVAPIKIGEVQINGPPSGVATQVVTQKTSHYPQRTVICGHTYVRMGRLIILLQALYAVFVPTKNVIVIRSPRIVADGVSTVQRSYLGITENMPVSTFTGREIVEIMLRERADLYSYAR